MLIDGLKFDLRIYVLLAGTDPLKIFVYDDGLVRLCTEKYKVPSKQNVQDTCIHLTNYAVNKENPKFNFNTSKTETDKGHKRTLKWFYEEYLPAIGINVSSLQKKIHRVIIKTFCSA